MEVQDLGLIRPAVINLVVVTAIMKFIEKKVLSCLRVRKVVRIVLLRLSTLPQLFMDAVKVVDIGLLRPSTFTKLIAEVMVVGIF